MFIAAARARKSIQRNFRDIGYEPDATTWRSVCMAVKRDLQAQRLRPNVAIPPRRNLLQYLSAMYAETGSLYQTVSSILHHGSWTSSGGSFKLAKILAFDFVEEGESRLRSGKTFRYLEVGAGWAGFRAVFSTQSGSIAELADCFEGHLGHDAFLHFTNITPWHSELPKGVIEHPYVTAASLSAVEIQGIRRGTVDIIYSQAAAYFEPDLTSFLAAASCLLRNGGVLIFNFRPEDSLAVSIGSGTHGLRLRKSIRVGGMDGVVMAFEKIDTMREPATRENGAGYLPTCPGWS